MRDLRVFVLSCLVYQGSVATAFGSADTIGPNGINSVGLPYTGEEISIGQVEPNRPAYRYMTERDIPILRWFQQPYLK